jgi:TonB family protein
MKGLIVVLLVLCAGCAVTEEVGQPVERPELVSLTPLPARSHQRIEQGLRLEVMMHVTKDGLVDDAELHNSSGDLAWDSMAVDAIKKWRFRAARRNSVPVDVWIRQQVTVEFQEPVFMCLSELICSTLEEADSMVALLKGGADFLVLARRSGGRLLMGEPGFTPGVDLAIFPPAVSNELRKLEEGRITPPLRVGDKYIIYKRVAKGTVEPSASLGMPLPG